MNLKTILKRAGAALAGALIVGEIVVRAYGLVDFPVYNVDEQIGYLIQPSQQGRFLNKNAWVFNDKSMGTAQKWNPSGHANLLLIGNSVVMGGNSYDQANKLGPLLQGLMPANITVWPIAVGGWTNVNETIYLERYPDVAKHANLVVWEYMSGGLSQLSAWRGDYVFPSEKPAWALSYAARRYVLPKFFSFDMNELPPTGEVSSEHLARFEKQLQIVCEATGRKHPGILFIYPTQAQTAAARAGMRWLTYSEQQTIERLSKTYGLQVIDVSRSPAWGEQFYRDGTHPTNEGNRMLASILRDAVQNLLTTEPAGKEHRPNL